MKAHLLLTLLLAAPVGAQQASANPVAAFLAAADNGDAMRMMAALGKDTLPKQIDGCYLRRVYMAARGEVLAAWMCAEGDKASRVVIGSVMGSGDKVKLNIVSETRNAIPAPPRTGPALAPAPETPQ